MQILATEEFISMSTTFGFAKFDEYSFVNLHGCFQEWLTERVAIVETMKVELWVLR